MKNLFLLPLLLLCMALNAQTRTKIKKVIVAAVSDSIPGLPKPTTKYTDNVDDRMKGPNGEKVFIGLNGGRYYLKAGKKIYVPLGIKNKKG